MAGFTLNQRVELSKLRELVESEFSGYQAKIEVHARLNDSELGASLRIYKDGKPYKWCGATVVLKTGTLTVEEFDRRFHMKDRFLSISDLEDDGYVPRYEPREILSDDKTEKMTWVDIFFDMSSLPPSVNGKSR